MFSWFRNLSIATKATTLLSLLALTLLLVLSGITYLLARQELQQIISTNQATGLSTIASQLDDKIAATRAFLQYVSNDLGTKGELSHKNAQEMLQHHADAFLFFNAGLVLLSPRGLIVAELPFNKQQVGLDRSGREYFQAVKQTGKPVVTAPYRSSITSETAVVTFAVPIKDQHGRLTGVLAGRHNLQIAGFLHSLVDETIGKTGYFYLFNQQRTLLVHPDPQRNLTTLLPGQNSAIDAALAGKEGIWKISNSKGIPGLTTIKRLKEVPWYLAAHYPLQEAYAPLSRARQGFIVVLLPVMILAVVAVWYSMNQVVGPLRKLTDHLQQLGKKQGSDRYLPVVSSDEIGRLTGVFNELLQELDDDALAQQESATIYRVITGFTNEVATWRLDNGDINYISSNCHSILGYQDAEFYADQSLFGRIIYADDRPIWESHKPGFYSMDGVGLVFRMVHKDGSIRLFKHFCQHVFDQQGNHNGVRGSYIDITAQHQLEITMRKLSSAVEQSASTIVITDTEGVIEYVNPRFVSTSGYTAEEAIGQHPSLLKSGNTPLEKYAELWRTIKSGREWRGELQNKRKDGTLYWESALISPLTDSGGSIIGFLAVNEDVTEQKAANQRLAELFTQVELAKLEWEQTLDHLHDYIILTDENHRIRRYNRILSDMSGREAMALVGLDWRDLLQELGFKFINFNAVTGELVHIRSARIYDINVYPISSNDGKLNGFVVSLNDTTELRSITSELEKALSELNDVQAKIYLQEKMASIGQLAAGVAHEINNPMGFITSNLGSLDKYISRLADYIGVIDRAMLQCNSAELTSPIQDARKQLKIDRILDDAHQLITECQDGSARVRMIVQDLKSFSRVDQAETALIDLNEALDTTINIARNELKYVAELKREFGDIPKLKCFPQQLNQVFLNLLVNAAHALGDSHGEISVATNSDDDWIVVKISDNGCGMTEEVQHRIFEPFFTTKEVGKGTGLGLSVSYEIIKKHGGDIQVESEVGRGSTFTVRLPLISSVPDARPRHLEI